MFSASSTSRPMAVQPLADAQQRLVVARGGAPPRGSRRRPRHVAAVGLVPGLVLAHVGEALDEFFDVVLVAADARQHRGRVLGVVEGDQHLLVVGFGGADEGDRVVQRGGVPDGVIRRDVAHDFGVQALVDGLAEHPHVLVADARDEAGGGVRPRGGRRPRWRAAATGPRRARRGSGPAAVRRLVKRLDRRRSGHPHSSGWGSGAGSRAGRSSEARSPDRRTRRGRLTPVGVPGCNVALSPQPAGAPGAAVEGYAA